MAPSPQALLTSLVANAACACGSKVESGEARKDEDALLEVGGVEIIVNNSGGHAHAVYPHFDDKPLANGHCHVTYPAFDCKPGGLIGEKMDDGAIINEVGIEIIAINGTNSHHPYAVYPYVGDRPDEPPDVDHGKHVVYPVFGGHFGGLIGEKPKDVAIINDDGVDIIARNGANGHHSHAVYPSFGNRPPDNPKHSHVMYPVLGDDFGGLIGEKPKDDAIINDDCVEIIASNGANGHHSHAVYPSFGNRPPDNPKHSHVMYPVLGDDFGGLIGEKPKDDAIINDDCVEIIASDDANGHYFGDMQHAHVVYPALGDNSGGLIGLKVEDNSMIENHSVEIAKDAIDKHLLSAEITAASTGVVGEGSVTVEAQRDVNDCWCDAFVQEDKKMAKLITAFFALPQEQVSHAMRMATEKVALKLDAPMQTCTGCGAQQEQHRRLSDPLTYMPRLIPAIT